MTAPENPGPAADGLRAPAIRVHITLSAASADTLLRGYFGAGFAEGLKYVILSVNVLLPSDDVTSTGR